MTGKVCGICHTGYRGTYVQHQGTDKHRRAVAGPAPGSRRSPRGESRRRAFRMMRSYDEGPPVPVRKYRRRRPLDGPRKVVKVDRYWRGWPYRDGMGAGEHLTRRQRLARRHRSRR